MRMRTIWDLTFPMSFKERVNRTIELMWWELADLIPKPLAFTVAYRQIGIATMKSAHVPATPLDIVLKNIQNHRDGKPIEEWRPKHMSELFPDDDHSVHVHVGMDQPPLVTPLDLNNLSEEDRALLPDVVRHFLEEKEKDDNISLLPDGSEPTEKDVAGFQTAVADIIHPTEGGKND